MGIIGFVVARAIGRQMARRFRRALGRRGDRAIGAPHAVHRLRTSALVMTRSASLCACALVHSRPAVCARRASYMAR